MKRYLITAVVLILGATSGHASSGFVTPLNTALGNGASVSCDACHTGGTSASTAITALAVTYKNSRNYDTTAATDSDGDGYTNSQEVSGSLIDFNDSAVSPFTKATGVNGTTTNIKALADTGATDTAFTDPQGLATTGNSVLGGIQVTLTQTDTVFYKAGGIDSYASVYTVDGAGAGTAVAAADWTADAKGSITIVNPPAGGFPADFVIVKPDAAAVVQAGADASVTGCIIGSASTPLVMFLVMLALGFLSGRKKD